MTTYRVTLSNGIKFLIGAGLAQASATIQANVDDAGGWVVDGMIVAGVLVAVVVVAAPILIRWEHNRARRER